MLLQPIWSKSRHPRRPETTTSLAPVPATEGPFGPCCACSNERRARPRGSRRQRCRGGSPSGLTLPGTKTSSASSGATLVALGTAQYRVTLRLRTTSVSPGLESAGQQILSGFSRNRLLRRLDENTLSPQPASGPATSPRAAPGDRRASTWSRSMRRRLAWWVRRSGVWSFWRGPEA